MPQSILVHVIGINLHIIPQKEKSNENGLRMLPRETVGHHAHMEPTASKT